MVVFVLSALAILRVNVTNARLGWGFGDVSATCGHGARHEEAIVESRTEDSGRPCTTDRVCQWRRAGVARALGRAGSGEGEPARRPWWGTAR